MGFIEFLENTGIAIFVRESPSLFGYTFVLGCHALGLAIVVGLSSIVSLRVLGAAREIPLSPMIKLFPLMYVGFTINAISGSMLFAANASGMLANTMFYIKIIGVALAVVAMSLLQRRFHAGDAHEARGLAYGILGSWLIAIVAGRLTAYPYFVEAWLGI